MAMRPMVSNGPMTRRSRPTPPAEPELVGEMRTLARLRQQSAEMRVDLARLEDAVVVAKSRIDAADPRQLKEVNQQLVLSSLKAQESADICALELGKVSSYAGLDVLTALPNRDVMMDRFAHAITVARRKQSRVALLFVDLDHFKEVNDSFGHSAGDAVLKQVAHCLVGAVREVDTVSRHGGDEFLILLADIAEPGEAGRVAEKVVAALKASGASNEHCPRLSASIGISVYPEDGDSPSELIERADAAMYLAKRNGAGKAVFHDARVREDRRERTPADEPPARSGAAPDAFHDHDEIVNADLREANGALVRAAIGAQQLQVAAELALRKQKEYLACVAHELRNPLAPLSVAVSLLRGADPACQGEMHGIIERQVSHMSRLVGDLLDLSRGETGKLRIHPHELELSAVVDDAVRAIRPSMEARRQKFEQRMPAQPLRLVADPVRMVQILSNLLDNASKYTPRGGEIRLCVEPRDGEVLISVSDNGIGVSPTSLAAVFEPFAQEPHAAGFSGKGLGIGLTVVRELVHLHGGRVVASSAGTGLGSEFTVTLPLAGNGADNEAA